VSSTAWNPFGEDGEETEDFDEMQTLSTASFYEHQAHVLDYIYGGVEPPSNCVWCRMGREGWGLGARV